MTEIINLDTREGLQAAYDGSYYFIAGAGGDLQDWINGYNGMLTDDGITTPTQWYITTGAHVNEFAGANFLRNEGDPFNPEVVCLLFSLDGIGEIGRLAMFKMRMQDRWFDDVIDNMKARL